MQTEYAVHDLGLPRFEHQQRMPEHHKGVVLRGRSRTSPSSMTGGHHHQHQHQSPVEYIHHHHGGNVDAFATMDGAVDLSGVSSSFEHLLDSCDPALLENWNPPASNANSWPSLNAHQSLPTPSSDGFNVAAAAETTTMRPSGAGGSRHKAQASDGSGSCRVRKLADGGPSRSNSQRPHYAVEKRYRSTLNEKYAALARALSSEPVQRICKSKSPTWSFDAEDTIPSTTSNPSNPEGNQQDHQQQPQQGGVKSRQRKTTTLSVVIETINILSVSCQQEAKELEQLRSGVNAIRNSAAQLLLLQQGTGKSTSAPSPSQLSHRSGAGSSTGGGGSGLV